MGKLTAKSVESLKEPGRYSDEDGSGFHVKVDAAGRKYYVLRAQVNGKRKDISIGPASKLTLSKARELARTKRAQLEGGGAGQASSLDFAHCAKLAHEARTVGYRNPKHVEQWISTLRTYADPVIGSKPIDQVTTGDVISILQPIWLEKPVTASRVLQRIDRVMLWAVGNNHRSHRIDMMVVRDALPRQPRKRSAVKHMKSVPWTEVQSFWGELQLSPSAPILRLALQFLILTAVRPGNIRQAKRSQLDLKSATWNIPAEEMKGGEEFRVALSKSAVLVAEQAMELHGHELLFAVRDKEISLDTLRMMIRRLGRDETPHGFRSTFKEWAREHDGDDHLSELALAHQDPNEVRAAYARLDLLDKRRPMMEGWADYVTALPGSKSGSSPA